MIGSGRPGAGRDSDRRITVPRRGVVVERFRREVIHREISRVLCPPTLWQPRSAKNAAQEKCCLTTPSFLSKGTRNHKPLEEAAPPAGRWPPSWSSFDSVGWIRDMIVGHGVRGDVDVVRQIESNARRRIVMRAWRPDSKSVGNVKSLCFPLTEGPLFNILFGL